MSAIFQTVDLDSFVTFVIASAYVSLGCYMAFKAVSVAKVALGISEYIPDSYQHSFPEETAQLIGFYSSTEGDDHDEWLREIDALYSQGSYEPELIFDSVPTDNNIGDFYDRPDIQEALEMGDDNYIEWQRSIQNFEAEHGHEPELSFGFSSDDEEDDDYEDDEEK